LRGVEVGVVPEGDQFRCASGIVPGSLCQIHAVGYGGQLAIPAQLAGIGIAPADIVDFFLAAAGRIDPALDHLDAVEAGAFRVHQRADQEFRCFALAAVQVSAHRHALAIADLDQVSSIVGGEIKAAKETDLHPRASGRIDFAAHHCVENGFPRVAGRPDRGIAARQIMPAKAALAGAEILRSHRAILGIGLVPAVLAEEIILVRRGQRCVAVGRTDHAEFERIGPDRQRQLQTPLQRFANIAAGIAFRWHIPGAAQIALVPAGNAEIGEFVIGGKKRMGFAVALDLGDLDDRFAQRPRLYIGGVNGAAVKFVHREHPAVRDIAVMRNGEHLAAGLLLVCGHVGPELLGVL